MEVFVAKQPILLQNEDIYGYELLYRNNFVNKFPNMNGDKATADVIINGFLNIGIEELAKGKPCFINFTENLLKLRLPTYFRSDEIVVEILETVEPSLEILTIVKELKKIGYSIALDDFIYNDRNPFLFALLRYVDIIKVDFQNTSSIERRKIEELAKSANVELLAEKIETKEEFNQACSRNYKYFQGYFFSEPAIISSKDVPAYFYSYYEIIRNLSEAEPNMEGISKLIEQDLSLSYKLLKLINSASFRPTQKINSIHQAVVLLGLVEIRKWISIMAVRGTTVTAKESAKEIISMSLTRAKICELIGKHVKSPIPTSSYFLTGLYSMLDALLNMQMKNILTALPLHEDICDALLGKKNILKMVLNLCIQVERGKWQNIKENCGELGIGEELVYSAYLDAYRWSNEIMKIEAESVSPHE